MFIIGTPHAKGAGYLQANTGGHNNRQTEADIRTCTHCQTVINLSLWKDDGGYCSRCQAPICGQCADRMLTHGCEPFIAQIERACEVRHSLEQFRRLAGLDAPPADYKPQIFIGGR